MELITDQLSIVPLAYEDFQLLLDDKSAFEAKMKLRYKGEPLKGHLLDVFHKQLVNLKNQKQWPLWYTLWLIILKEKRTVIGSLCFKNKPSLKGMVEIGYGLNRRFEGQGYMTSALKALIAWTFTQPHITGIVAETDQSNVASQKVLQKCGFRNYKQTKQSFWWICDYMSIQPNHQQKVGNRSMR